MEQNRNSPRPPLSERAVRQMRLWDAQVMTAVKRALRAPNMLQEVVLDISETKEVWLSIVAEERVKLIVPEDDDV